MTAAENTAIAPRDDAAFVFKAGGARFYPQAGARLSFASRTAASLFLPGLPVDLLDGSSVVTVEYRGREVFEGRPGRSVERTVRGLTVRDVTCLDHWHLLERRVFRQTWKVVGGGGAAVESSSARVVLNVDALGQPVALAGQLGEACSAGGCMMSDGGIPVVALPSDVAENITCADAIRRLLRLFPQVVARAVPPYEGRIVEFSVPDGQASPGWLAEGRVLSRTRQYTEHPVVGVDIATEAVDTVVTDAATGATADMRAITHQTAGDTASDDCLHVYMPLAGGSASTSRETIDVEVEDPDMLNAEWWKKKHPRLDNNLYDTVTILTAGRDSYTYGKITKNDVGALRAFGLGAEVVRFWCTVKVETEDDVEEELYLTMDFATTDASKGRHTRQTGSSYTEPETLPEGLAKALLDQRGGALEGEDVEIALGDAFPQVGESLDGLVCQTVEVDCDARVARLRFGHPGYLSAEDMRSLLNGFRARGHVSNVPLRGSAEPEGGSIPVAGGIMPLSTTEFSPGTKAKTTIRRAGAGGAAAASGRIVLDADEVDAGESVAVRDVTFADGSKGKALATKALEVCYV